MSNPLGAQDIVGNRVIWSDLFGASRSPLFPANATSNVFQVPCGETIIVLCALASGSAVFNLQTGTTAATAGLSTVASVTASDTTTHAIVYQTPTVAYSATAVSTPQTLPIPGTVIAPFFAVNVASSGSQVSQLAVLTLGLLQPGAEFPSARASINAVLSYVINTGDSVSGQPPVGFGSGAFTVGLTASLNS